MNTSRCAALAAISLVCVLLPGCPQSPQSICQHMVDSVDAMYERCGLPYHTTLTFDGMPTDCHHVSRISDGGNQIVHTCIPWTSSVACDAIPVDGSGLPMINPPCDFSMLQEHP